MVKIKNILLVGGTGSGKSTLANVITGTNEFKESDYSISETKKLQIGASEKFEDGEIKYQIIDTVGIGDTKSMERYLHSLAMLGDCIKDGLSQILLVTNGSLEEKTKETFDFIKEVFFDDNVIDYITIVRTNFANFGDENKIARDKERLVGKKGVFRKIVRADKVIHVNNPSIDLIINEENEESKKEMLEEQREINRIVRKESRKILLDYLEKSCKNIYKPKNLDSLNEFIETKKIEGFFQYIEDRNLTEFLENLESLREESQDSLSQISLTSKENKEEVIKQEIKKKIKQKSIIGTRILEPKLEDFFTTDLKNYLIVTSHKLYYANWLFAYEEKDGKVKLGEGERFPNPNSISGYLTKDIALSKVKKIREKTKNRDGISYLEKKNNELQEKVIQLETKLNHYQSQIEV